MQTAFTLGGQPFPGWSPLRYSALSCALGWFAIVALPAIVALAGHRRPAGHSRPPQAHQLLAVWPQPAFIILCVSVFGILCWNMVVARLGPLSAGLFANFAPVITYLIALAQGRRPANRELMGAGVVLVALIANNLQQRSKLGRIGD